MLESIIYAFALAFILCGMLFICLLIFDKTTSPKGREKYFLLVPGRHGDETLPETLYHTVFSANLMTLSKRSEVVVLDMGLDEFEKRACENMLAGFGTVIFCTGDKIEDLFVETKEKK